MEKQQVTPITLPWMNKLRERLLEPKFRLNAVVQEFIHPIMQYGEAEELRITAHFAKQQEEITQKIKEHKKKRSKAK